MTLTIYPIVVKNISLAHCGLCDPREIIGKKVCAHTQSKPSIPICFVCAAQVMAAIQTQAFMFDGEVQ